MCVCHTHVYESLCCILESNTTLYINYNLKRTIAATQRRANRRLDSSGKKTGAVGGGNGGIKFGGGRSDQVQMWGYSRAGIRNDIPPSPSIFQSVLCLILLGKDFGISWTSCYLTQWACKWRDFYKELSGKKLKWQHSAHKAGDCSGTWFIKWDWLCLYQNMTSGAGRFPQCFFSHSSNSQTVLPGYGLGPTDDKWQQILNLCIMLSFENNAFLWKSLATNDMASILDKKTKPLQWY